MSFNQSLICCDHIFVAHVIEPSLSRQLYRFVLATKALLLRQKTKKKQMQFCLRWSQIWQLLISSKDCQSTGKFRSSYQDQMCFLE